MIEKRQACTEFISVSANRQEPEAASITVNWIVRAALFWPSGQLTPSSPIYPTKPSAAKTRRLCLSCLMGIALAWFWPPEHPWDLHGTVLTWTWTKARQELVSRYGWLSCLVSEPWHCLIHLCKLALVLFCGFQMLLCVASVSYYLVQVL